MSDSGSHTEDLDEPQHERLEEFSDLGGEAEEEEEDSVNSSAGDVSNLDEEGDAGWPDRETAKLIELFRNQELLYDVGHKYYSNRDKKEGTYSKMATKLGFSGRLLVVC
jgi:hypothetical protein